MGYFTEPNLRLENSDSVITATRDLTNHIDCQNTPVLRDLGIKPMFIEAIVTEAFNNLTSLTLSFVTDSTTNLDTSETAIVAETIALARLTLGAKFVYALKPGQTYERYLGGEVTVTGTAPTTGKLHVCLVPAVDSIQYFADGSSIS